MSYDIDLIDPITGEILEADAKHHVRGGTYAVGGTTMLSLNVTYNYAPLLYDAMGKDGIRTIYGMTSAESIPVLEDAISKLGDNVSDDYWELTGGNVKRALLGLKALAQLRPDGVWQGD